MGYGNRPHTQFWEKSREAENARDCPRCGRPKGEPCKNLRVAAWKEEVDLTSAHKERYDGTD